MASASTWLACLRRRRSAHTGARGPQLVPPCVLLGGLRSVRRWGIAPARRCVPGFLEHGVAADGRGSAPSYAAGVARSFCFTCSICPARLCGHEHLTRGRVVPFAFSKRLACFGSTTMCRHQRVPNTRLFRFATLFDITFA